MNINMNLHGLSRKHEHEHKHEHKHEHELQLILYSSHVTEHIPHQEEKQILPQNASCVPTRIL